MTGLAHVKTQEEVVDWPCAFGECDHDDENDCQPKTVDVCAACSENDRGDDDELFAVVLWAWAEEHVHGDLSPQELAGLPTPPEATPTPHAPAQPSPEVLP